MIKGILDFAVVAIYMAAMVLMGFYFRRRQTSTEKYFVAGRSIPGWAAGMSIFAALISSVTFIAYPGWAYGRDWSLLTPGFAVPIVLVLVAFVMIPFFRRVVGMSAYEYFEHRFSYGARLYGSIAFSFSHFSKMGFVFYLLALTIESMTGWPVDAVIIVSGLVTIFYTLIGGLEAVIWTDVVQGFILWAGIVICLGFLLFVPPGGPSAVLGLAWENSKYGLGSLDLDFTKASFIVLILYGLSWNVQKYSIDQTIVQRYLVAKSDRAALRGVALGGLLCIPVWTLFMLIGTCVWSFYRLTGAVLPAGIRADQVFPHFLATQLPPGLSGLFMASLLAAAMSTLSSDLNCLSAVAVEDVYRRIKPSATDRMRLAMGKKVVFVCGALAIVIAEVLAHNKGSALDLWFTVTSIVAGGLAGLFLLAFLSVRANVQGAYIGIIVSLIFTGWATLTMSKNQVIDMGALNFPLHEYMIGVIGHMLVLVVGYLASLFFPYDPSKAGMTIWGLLESRKAGRMATEALSDTVGVGR